MLNVDTIKNGLVIDHIKAEEVEIVHVREGWLLRMPKPRAIM